MFLDLPNNLRNKATQFLLVEQNVRQALQVGDRAYIIETGRIIKSGTTEELLKDPDVKKSYLGM